MGIDLARKRLESAGRIGVLSGAGISAPSGIPTFRDAEGIGGDLRLQGIGGDLRLQGIGGDLRLQGIGGDLRLRGLWKDFRIEDFATPQAYARDPQKVWEWYAWRYKKVTEVQPNKAHRLLAELENGREHRAQSGKHSGFTLVTQNVDGLHARAGSLNIVELHGNITRGRCERCGHRFALPEPEHFVPPAQCPRCGSKARPDVVWFGELLPEEAFEKAERAFAGCEVAMVIGTSAQVEPAASLARVASWAGAYVIEINPEETPLSRKVDLSLRMGAIEGLEKLLE